MPNITRVLGASVAWGGVACSDPDIVIVSPCGYRTYGAAELAGQLRARGVLADEFPASTDPRIAV